MFLPVSEILNNSNAKTRNQTQKIPAQKLCFAEKVGTERPRRRASQSRGQMGGTVPLGRDPVARTRWLFGFRSDSNGFVVSRRARKKDIKNKRRNEDVVCFEVLQDDAVCPQTTRVSGAECLEHGDWDTASEKEENRLDAGRAAERSRSNGIFQPASTWEYTRVSGTLTLTALHCTWWEQPWGACMYTRATCKK